MKRIEYYNKDITLAFLVISPINIYSAVAGVGLGAHGLNIFGLECHCSCFGSGVFGIFGLKHSEEISS